VLCKPPWYSLHLTESFAIIRAAFKSPKCGSFETCNSVEVTLKSCGGDYSMSYCVGYCLRQASRHGPLNSVNRLLNERHSVCIHTQSIGLWCVPTFMTVNLTIGETPLNGRVKEQRRNRKEQRPKKSISVLTPYSQTFPIPSNRGRKTIKRRRKWDTHARP